MIDNSKISIIVPIYNSEKFLAKCIDSIINQTYTNTEIVLVNDGSTDGTIDILNYYEKQYKNIIVIHKENEGCDIARNKGLDISTGDFIMFVDSDDYLLNSACETVISAIINSKADFVCFGAKFYSNSQKNKIGFRYSYKKILGSNILLNFLLTGEIKMVIWNKIYRKSTIEKFKIRFPYKRSGGDRSGGDSLFTMAVALHSKHAILIPELLYCHTSVNPLSFTNNLTIEHFISYIEVLNYKRKLLIQNDLHSKLGLYFEIHSAKSMTHLMFLAALNITNYNEFKKCAKIITNSKNWTSLNKIKTTKLPLIITLRIALFKQQRLIWYLAKTIKQLGFYLQ